MPTGAVGKRATAWSKGDEDTSLGNPKDGGEDTKSESAGNIEVLLER